MENKMKQLPSYIEYFPKKSLWEVLKQDYPLILKPLLIGFVLLTIVFVAEAKANYSFPPKDRTLVTMDVDKVNGGGGTWRCPSVYACYIKVLEAEHRGADQYCNSIVIKRNGRVVWWRNYR